MLFLALAAIAAAVPAWAQEPVPAPVSSTDAAAVPAATGATGASGAPINQSLPGALSLPEALRQALAQNPAIGGSRAEVEAAQAQSDVIFSGILPRINLAGDFTRNSDEVTFGSGSDARTILPENDWSYRLTLSQPIYAGNRERKAIRQSRLNVENARHGVEDLEDQVITDVVAGYLGVIQSQELIAVEERNVEIAHRRREQAQIFFEAGETTRVDTLRAEAAIKESERRLATARQLREIAAGRLRLALAVEGPVVVEPPGELFPALPSEPALLATAEERRPEVAQAVTDLEIATLEVGKQKGARLPVVTADGAWIRQQSAFPSDDYGQLSLRVNVPVYQSGEVAGRVAVARGRQRQAELRLQEVKQAVREEVHQALVDLETSESRLRLTQEQLAASEAEFQQAAELYRAQELTSLEAEAAQTSLAEARRAVVAGQLDRDLAELRVWAAAGMLKQIVPLEDAP